MRSYFWGMFIRKKKNRSNKVIKTIGVAKTKREEELLMMLAETEMERIRGIRKLFVEHDDLGERVL